MAAFAPLLATHDPYEQILSDRLQPPSMQHYFGTDSLGRDIYSRVVFGSRVTLAIAVLVAAISTPLGLVIGVLAGYFGKAIDEILMRLSDIFLAFPKLILAIAFAAALGPGVENAIVAISIANWPSYARLARAETLTCATTTISRSFAAWAPATCVSWWDILLPCACLRLSYA